MGCNTVQDYGPVQMTDDKIVGTMTIGEAFPLWSDPRQELLNRWAETFGVPLKELHPGHVVTYQRDRGKETTSSRVDAEVGAVLALLRELGIGVEIERYNRPLSGAGELTPAELCAMPESVLKYIDNLKHEILNLQARCYRLENRIRRTNWGRSY